MAKHLSPYIYYGVFDYCLVDVTSSFTGTFVSHDNARRCSQFVIVHAYSISCCCVYEIGLRKGVILVLMICHVYVVEITRYADGLQILVILN